MKREIDRWYVRPIVAGLVLAFGTDVTGAVLNARPLPRWIELAACCVCAAGMQVIDVYYRKRESK